MNGDDFRMISLVKFNNGIYIDEKEITGVTYVELESAVNDISELTIKMLCKVDGLDNISKNLYSFKPDKLKKEYKPSRKYLSR